MMLNAGITQITNALIKIIKSYIGNRKIKSNKQTLFEKKPMAIYVPVMGGHLAIIIPLMIAAQMQPLAP